MTQEIKDKFEFRESDHAYLYEGKRVTGVTSVIGVLAKPALIGWAAKMAVEYLKEVAPMGQFINEDVWLSELENARTAHTKKKEDAGTHGTDAHALVEEYINVCIDRSSGLPAKLHNNVKMEPIAKFVDWAVENVDHFLFAERRMFDLNTFLAGTADFAYIGKDGKKYMGDFKTSSGIYGIDYFLQCAGYRFLAESEGDEPYDGTTIVRLGKDGSFEVQNRYDYKTDLEAFMACLTLYRAQATFKKTTWK